MYGAKATISVWDPTVESRDEFSLSQIWITSGSYKENNLNSIEAGWQSDRYNVTGCYNLWCPGFIQTSDTIVIGGSITPISAFEGNQFEITISLWKDRKSGNWWLSLGSNHSLVGYWPAAIFANLAYADDVQWGGEIVNSNISGLTHYYADGIRSFS
ncbi:Neprosin [Arabidopsis suecica]|uniref:Neprosin n=1 Tax=Arabidopsis suecica TaxID=45249 RepID=A0A8T2GAY4_ARASU|nr:Neprosin [Arabidopsis suecica]